MASSSFGGKFNNNMTIILLYNSDIPKYTYNDDNNINIKPTSHVRRHKFYGRHFRTTTLQF